MTGKYDCPWCHTLHDDDSRPPYGYCSDKCQEEAIAEEQPAILDWIYREQNMASVLDRQKP